MPTTILTTAEALAKQAMMEQLDTFLEGEAAKSVRDRMLMPADFCRHYDDGKRLAATHEETGVPLGWLVWNGRPGEPSSLDRAVRLYAVARSCLGLPLPRLPKRRRARKAVAHV